MLVTKKKSLIIFHENYPILATEKMFGDRSLSYRFSKIKHDSGFRLSKTDKNYWYFLILLNDSVLIIDDTNIKDFLTPINSIEKLISYFHYEVKIVNDNKYRVYDNHITIEEDGYSFLVLDMDNSKSSQIRFWGRNGFRYKRTPLLKIRTYTNGEYTFEKIKIYKETLNLKNIVGPVR